METTKSHEMLRIVVPQSRTLLQSPVIDLNSSDAMPLDAEPSVRSKDRQSQPLGAITILILK